MNDDQLINTDPAKFADGKVKPNSNDHSDMPHEARRVLVYLMRRGAILQRQKQILFAALCRYQTPIRNHLAEIYLKLTLDDRSGIAFISSFDETTIEAMQEGLDKSDVEIVSPISSRLLSLEDTLMLLVLRKFYQERESTGEQVIAIDKERIESLLEPFAPIAKSKSLADAKLLARIKTMRERKVLTNIRGSEDRYEISPLIRYVVDAAFLETMLVSYERMANEAVQESHD